MRAIPSSAKALSTVSLLGAAVASAVTLAWSGAFPDPPGGELNVILAEARGWSAVTLLLAVPLGAVALGRAGRSLRARLWWAGTLAYLVYTYLEFAVAPPFTWLYLVYIATFATAIPALVMAVSSVDLDMPVMTDRAPRRAVIAFSLVVSLGLAAAWLKDIVTRLADGSGAWLEPLAAVRHAVEALDLGLQVPLGLAAAILLLGRHRAGWLVASIYLVMAVCMGAALTGMVGASALLEGENAMVAAPFAVLFVVASVLAVATFSAVRETGASAARRKAA